MELSARAEVEYGLSPMTETLLDKDVDRINLHALSQQSENVLFQQSRNVLFDSGKLAGCETRRC